MNLKRRYAHLTIILTAYSFLILVARWAFFTEMWTIMGTEPEVDGSHAHAHGLQYAMPLRSQRDVSHMDIHNNKFDPTKLKYKRADLSETGRTLKKDYIAKVNKRNQLLHTIFTNFLHP